MKWLRARFPRACLAGALVAAPIGALVQRSFDWEILYVHTATHWGIDAAIYAVAIAVIALLAGALGILFRWLFRGLPPLTAAVLTTLTASAFGLLAFRRLISWPLDGSEIAKLYLVLAAFYGVFCACMPPSSARASGLRPGPT